MTMQAHTDTTATPAQASLIGRAAALAYGSVAYAELAEWLETRPPDRLFEAALSVIKAGLSVLSPEERAERMRRLLDDCNRVAHASGGLLELLGMGGNVSGHEAEILEAITGKLRAKPNAGA